MFLFVIIEFLLFFSSLFYQFQMVFGHLLESRLQYHAPEKFWKCFRLWGQPINVREQQDAFEFFTHLIDQVDEYLIKNEWDPVFKPKYEGTFSDQKICQGCPHRYLLFFTNDIVKALLFKYC